MKHVETVAPVAAAVSALVTLVCCLPIAFAAGTATTALAVVAGSYRSWLLAAAAGLLILGAVQLVRVRRACAPRGSGSMVILSVSATIVLLVLFFPQLIAGLIADWMP